MTLFERLAQAAQTMRQPVVPNIVKLTGEAEDPDDAKIADFAALTEEQWHRLQVERRYRENHHEDWCLRHICRVCPGCGRPDCRCVCR
jgi:hypothetical protein